MPYGKLAFNIASNFMRSLHIKPNWHKKIVMQHQAVWIIDSDEDDRYMVQEVWRELELTNELIFLKTADEALALLDKIDEAPFIILCSVNLPGISGFELREKMLSIGSPKFTSVPFIFWSTAASEQQIVKAYHLSVHGFFIKDNTFSEMKATFVNIINYWMKSKMPSKQVTK
jgi:CheY-like chemotaxis protein